LIAAQGRHPTTAVSAATWSIVPGTRVVRRCRCRCACGANRFSLAESCKIDGVEPHRYLVALFKTLSAANAIDSDAASLLWNTRERQFQGVPGCTGLTPTLYRQTGKITEHYKAYYLPFPVAVVLG
jgi:hypothetical protein